MTLWPLAHAQGIDEWTTASPLRKIERKGESNLVDRSKMTTKSLTPIGRVDPNGFAALLGTDVSEEDLAGVGSGDASVGDAARAEPGVAAECAGLASCLVFEFIYHDITVSYPSNPDTHSATP